MTASSDTRNFSIRTNHPLWRNTPVSVAPFKGKLTGAKTEAQKILRQQKGTGWKVTVESEGRTIYCCW